MLRRILFPFDLTFLYHDQRCKGVERHVIVRSDLGIAGKGKSTAAIYASVLISDVLPLRLSDFLDR